jgi:hypothetical protein
VSFLFLSLFYAKSYYLIFNDFSDDINQFSMIFNDLTGFRERNSWSFDAKKTSIING